MSNSPEGGGTVGAGVGFGAAGLGLGCGGIYRGTAVGAGCAVAAGAIGAGWTLGAALTTFRTAGLGLRRRTRGLRGRRGSRSAGTVPGATSRSFGSAVGGSATAGRALGAAFSSRADDPPLNNIWTVKVSANASATNSRVARRLRRSGISRAWSGLA